VAVGAHAQLQQQQSLRQQPPSNLQDKATPPLLGSVHDPRTGMSMIILDRSWTPGKSKLNTCNAKLHQDRPAQTSWRACWFGTAPLHYTWLLRLMPSCSSSNASGSRPPATCGTTQHHRSLPWYKARQLTCQRTTLDGS
jgi:hypothetical protein